MAAPIADGSAEGTLSGLRAAAEATAMNGQFVADGRAEAAQGEQRAAAEAMAVNGEFVWVAQVTECMN